MIAVVVPAHNEQDTIEACLESLKRASECPALNGEDVMIVVVLDACTDATHRVASAWGAETVTVQARNVGIARHAGAQHALDAGARWLAFTDADTQVASTWCSAQLALDSDAVCGTIAVADWSAYGSAMALHFAGTYTDADGHRHVHGANLGVSAEAYRQVGGFKPLASSEDVAFVDALRKSGASIAWSATPRVVTSARRHYRAPNGFGATLARVDGEQRQADGAA